MTTPRLVIAAPQSGSGKTTVSIGLMAGLTRTLCVQAFKCGPDYIDPAYHMLATGRPSRNLDTWLMSHDAVKQIWGRACGDADIAIIEGVMGLYDGYDALTERGSTAEIAKLLKTPVILVIDVSKMARSVAAIALGCQQYDSDLNICGVICNNVASDTHARWVREAIEAINIPVLGCIPRTSTIALPERHLGLYTAHEHDNQADLIQQIADVITQYVDLDRLLEIAKSAPIIGVDIPQQQDNKTERARIAIARDLAFNFYYEDNVELLIQSGAEVVFFSPLDDEQLPENINGLYIGGGYPELYAEQLSQNIGVLSEIRELIGQGLPTYAECGGLMLLTEAFVDEDGQAYPLVGAIAGQTQMNKKLTMGYRELVAQRDTLLLHQGETMRGHEFHYSIWTTEHTSPAYKIAPRYQKTHTLEGYTQDNLLASYIHLHFASQPIVAERFVKACQTWQLQVEEVTP